MAVSSIVARLLDHLPPPSTCCQAVHLFLASGSIFAAAALPRDVKRLVVDYGAREEKPRQPEEKKDVEVEQSPAAHARIVRELASRTAVPHSWFGSYYAVSAALSVFWACQILHDGSLLHLLASRERSAAGPSMTMGQVYVVWALMTAQGLRRLCECMTLVKPSSSKMGFIHLLLGWTFYACMSVSVWIEGSRAIIDHRQGVPAVSVALPVQTIIATPVFLVASIMQNRCHAYLTSLKKYSLPDRGLFCSIVCPHYTCECLLYLAMAVAAAPKGQLCNRTLLCALCFVAGNLGITAGRTKEWYAQKFGKQRVAARWAMIPFVF